MAELTFAFVYYCGLTSHDMVGAVMSLMAGLFLHNLVRQGRPDR